MSSVLSALGAEERGTSPQIVEALVTDERDSITVSIPKPGSSAIWPHSQPPPEASWLPPHRSRRQPLFSRGIAASVSNAELGVGADHGATERDFCDEGTDAFAT